MNPIDFTAHTYNLGQVDIHLLHNSSGYSKDGLINDEREPILLLHGFPEYHGSWRHVMPHLAEQYLVIAPDQRGYNLSSAPQEIDAYQVRWLAEDMINLLDHLIPDRQCHLVGHDWGASVAYALAMKHPGRFKTLNIINGVHPIPFQRALVNDVDQIAASQYIHVLRAENAAEHLSENGFARTLSMFDKFSNTDWLDSDLRQDYVNAWSHPGRMNAMLNWYRASPMIVPELDQFDPSQPIKAPLLDADPEHFQIRMPHLVVWGMRDSALLPVSRNGLDQFARDLHIVEVSDAGHWINHTHGEFVAGEIDKFIQAKS